MGHLLLIAAITAAEPPARLSAVPFTAVSITDSFWAPRIEINRTATLPHTLDQCDMTGRIANFSRAAGLVQGKHEGAHFNDSDVLRVAHAYQTAS